MKLWFDSDDGTIQVDAQSREMLVDLCKSALTRLTEEERAAVLKEFAPVPTWQEPHKPESSEGENIVYFVDTENAPTVEKGRVTVHADAHLSAFSSDAIKSHHCAACNHYTIVHAENGCMECDCAENFG